MTTTDVQSLPSGADGARPQPVRSSGRGVSWLAKRRRFMVNSAVRIVLIAALLALWQYLSDSGHLNQLFFSRPSSIWDEIVQLAQGGGLLSQILATLYEAAAGFVLGTVAGVAIGFGLALVPRVGEILDPFVAVFNALPRLALAPLMLLWFGYGHESKIVLVFSLVVFILLINTQAGAMSIDGDIATLSRLFGASRAQMILKVMLPSTLPWIIAGMRLAIAYAISGAVVGEMFAGQDGIGYLMSAASGVLNTTEIFAGLLLIMIIAWVVDLLAKVLETRLLRWRREVALS
jgi:NitT/TauT family transport system permease protein